MSHRTNLSSNAFSTYCSSARSQYLRIINLAASFCRGISDIMLRPPPPEPAEPEYEVHPAREDPASSLRAPLQERPRDPLGNCRRFNALKPPDRYPLIPAGQ